jgi:hypothetical protein
MQQLAAWAGVPNWEKLQLCALIGKSLVKVGFSHIVYKVPVNTFCEKLASDKA